MPINWASKLFKSKTKASIFIKNLAKEWNWNVEFRKDLI
jgi:hypothetical protein